MSKRTVPFGALPQAQEALGKDMQELWDQIFHLSFHKESKKTERQDLLFEMSRIKDLAKLLMKMRLSDRVYAGRYGARRDDWEPWNRNFRKSHRDELWREIIASEEMRENNRERMMRCPREFAGDREEFYRLYSSMLPKNIVKKRKDIALQAFALLEKKMPYKEIAAKTNLSFEELRVMDCFTTKS